MKIVFIGGGAHRLVAILRSVLAQAELTHGGEINLYDLDVSRSEVVGRLVQKTPEYAKSGCRIVWGTSLEEALQGADAVGVILMAGSHLNFALGDQICWKHGFVPSDNVSPNGAILGIKGVPIVMNLARKMESLCPDAWLLNFANPVAVLSAAVNRHTKIKTLGLCQGYANHYNDIARIFGKDDPLKDLSVRAVGINHLSFIVEGKLGGRDFFPQLDACVANGWKMPPLSPHWSASARRNITNSVTKLVSFYKRLGILIFSTEGDGMLHLDYDSVLEERAEKVFSQADLEALVQKKKEERMKAARWLESHVNQDLNGSFWPLQNSGVFGRADDDIFVKVLKGIGGPEEVEIVTSFVNRGAVSNLPAGVATEYSQILHRQKIRPAGIYAVPDIAQGLISSLATHQTMLADACATEDPKLLAEALMAYPVRPYSRSSREMFRELILLNKGEIPMALSAAEKYLKN